MPIGCGVSDSHGSTFRSPKEKRHDPVQWHQIKESLWLGNFSVYFSFAKVEADDRLEFYKFIEIIPLTDVCFPISLSKRSIF